MKKRIGQKNKKNFHVRLFFSLLFLVVMFFVTGCTNNAGKAPVFLNDIRPMYIGHQNTAHAQFDKKQKLSVYKEIARYEAKSADVYTDSMKKFISNSSSVARLKNSYNLDTRSLSNKDQNKVNDFFLHMENTSLYLTNKANLKNGDKVNAIVKDDSDKQYFKKQSKEYTVSNLKKLQTFQMKDFNQYFYVQGIGHSGRGSGKIHIKISKNSNPKVKYDQSDLDSLFHSAGMDTNSNGEKVAAYEKKVAKLLTDSNPDYKFVGRPRHPIKLTIKGLKNGNGSKPSNLGLVNIQASMDDPKFTLVLAQYDPDEHKLYLVYKSDDPEDKANPYFDATLACTYKNNKLYGMSGDLLEEDHDAHTVDDNNWAHKNKDLNKDNYKHQLSGNNVITFIII